VISLPKKIVITGGPSTGKTSVIDALEEKGYICLNEVIRSMTSQEQSDNVSKTFKSNPIVSVDDPMAFNQKVLDARLNQYQTSLQLDEEAVFFDRGVHDVLGYMDCFKQEYGLNFINAAKETSYDIVFIMPLWPEIFTSDSERFESFEEAIKVDACLMNIYQEYGYDVKIVPKDSVEKRVDYILTWGFENFKGSQETIINAILKEQDVLALLPTGGGKSICFQVPAMVKEGICIVVSPLIALIQNQVDSLKEKGIKAIALTGGIPASEVNNLLDNCVFGNYKFLYLSPERLQQELVQKRIQQMNVNLIAIDEAHCISQWGHDFRPAYLECSKLRALLPETPLIALTATATKQVANDIVDSLKFINSLLVKDSFARKNIGLKVFWEEDKRYRLKILCSTLKKSAIVYVRTRRLAQEIAQFLNSNTCSATYFHGGIPKSEKQEKLKLWLNNKVQTMVATNAFGMGIDKPDVELVVHYQIPDCIENYFQEAGRAGRDGNAAEAVLITSLSEIGLQQIE